MATIHFQWLTRLGLGIALWGALCAPSMGSEFSVDRYTHSADGKDALDALHDIAFGPKGFVWLASETGLLRFDGHQVVRYGVAEGLAGEFATGLAFDHHGKLWVTTNKGVSLFDPEYETLSTWPTHHWFGDVLVSAAGNAYAGGTKGLYQLAQNHEPMLVLGDYGLVQKVYEDRHGRLWLGTADQGLVRYDPVTAEHTQFAFQPGTPFGLPANQVRAIHEDADGQLWVGTWGAGLCRYLPEQGFVCYREQGLRNAIITDLYCDHAGQLWISVDKGGLYRYRPATDDFEHFSHDPLDEHSLLSDTVRILKEDANHNLWAVTFPGGLNRHHPVTRQFARWRHHALNANSLLHSAILAIAQDRYDNVWVGTEGGLSQIRDSQVVRQFKPEPENPQSLNTGAVTAIAPDKQRLWLGTWSGGLLRLDTETGLFERLHDPEHPLFHPGENIWALLLDSQGQLWVGSERFGLSRLAPDAKAFEHFRRDVNNPHTLTSDYILNIVEAPDHRIWIATQAGLNVWQPETHDFQQITHVGALSLSDVSMKSLHFSDSDTLWIASQSHGVLRWQMSDNRVTHIDQAAGLPSNTTSALTHDANGDLWVSTLGGVARVDAQTLQVSATLTEQDGLAGRQSNRNAMLLSNNGQLWVGATGGLSRFEPTQLTLPTTPPRVELTQMTVMGQRLKTVDAGNDQPMGLAYASRLVLPNEAHYFEIDFTNINFNEAAQQGFRYQLAGFDRDWVELSGSHTAHYANLDAGNYTFTVAAKDRNGNWSPHTRDLAITILAPWYLSAPAYLLYVVLTAALLAGIIRLVFLRTLNHQLRYQVATRTAELAAATEAKSRFFVNVSHELRTPLTSINGYARRLLHKHADQCDERMLKALNAILRNGEHLNDLLTDILDMAKIESGKMQIQPVHCDIHTLVHDCLDDFQSSADAKGLTLVAPTSPMYPIMADPQRLKQILHNLLSNAIKYTDRGAVFVALDTCEQNAKEYCVITVKDSGKGMDPEQQAKLFKRFEQVDEHTKYIHGYGTGLGLSLVAEFTALHGGFVECSSRKGAGSEFRVYLPTCGPALSS